MNKRNHTLVCRNCKLKVAKTPNKICVNCSIPSWGYTHDELEKINNPQNQTIQKFVCKNCDNTVVRTPMDKCHVCSMPFWGYSEFELNNGLVKAMESVPGSKIGSVASNEPKRRNLLPVLASLFLLLFAGTLFFLLPTSQGNTIIPENPDIDSIAYASTIEEIQKAVTFIKTSKGTGTGFLISKKYILTAGHVACDNNSFEVTFTKNRNVKKRGKLAKCALIASRTDFDFFERDYALIEIPPVQKIKPLKLGNSSEVTELDKVFTAGHSLGDINLSMTEGNISRLKYGEDSFDLFSHTIASNPGNSGGPIIMEETNEVIGILVGGRSAIITESNLIIPQGENIGVKINNVKNALIDFLTQN